MRLILSRKGFDSTAGGVASPIFAGGAMLSLPIPDRASPVRYEDITLGGHRLGPMVADLTRGKQQARFGAHLDPDLVRSAFPRKRGWRPIFGQAGGEQTVLAREGVGPGDLFLFFGWFRRVEYVDGAFRFVKGAPDLHVLWGWMQIDAVLDVATAALPAWARDHPHVAAAAHRINNTIYVARDALALDGRPTGRPGAGVFARYDDRLCLTTPGASRSRWTLPGWFAPRAGRPPLGYHRDPTRWRRAGDRVELRSVARGQEFVLDTAHYPEARPWVRGLMACATRGGGTRR
jgi:Nucleotide modification associated domain 3